MKTKKKAFNILYNLIANQQLTNKEAYDIADAIFEVEFYPVAVPNPIDVTAQENQQEQVKQIEVAGFRLPE